MSDDDMKEPGIPWMHGSMYRDGIPGTLCREGWEPMVTTVMDKVTCPYCRQKIDGGEAEQAMEGMIRVVDGDGWRWVDPNQGGILMTPPEVEFGPIGADERTQALKDARSLLISGLGRAPRMEELLLVAEYVLNGVGGYLVTRKAMSSDD